MAHKKRTQDELLLVSEHLYYEYSMFISTADALASEIAWQVWLKNAILEAFVIHFRALLDFLYAKNKYNGDDVIALDFFTDKQSWEKVRPPITPFLEKAKKRAHKEIAHLTYSRLNVTPEAKLWEFLKIKSEIKDLIVLFIKSTPGDLICPNWKK